ncbi:restriction endonuclease subunit S domain-containing protein [Sunxiuqinia indica]|uniref:hypothetical protein n=1 Tax=Sunxiuqinia indica TaxID=2692584 RepID=UPI00135B4258|nr:hypothetical protein [Sunxiuqinia indica]
MNFDKSFARKDDVLVARVGSRVIGKFCLIENETIEISDCVFRVSMPPQFIQPFLNALDSDYGKKWFEAYSHGVCARLISKENLLEFKIP